MTGDGTPSNQRTGRWQTYRSSNWRSATFSDRMPPPIPKSDPAVENPAYDVVDYEEPCPNQPVIYDTKKLLERERRASVVSESPYHVESDGYLIVTATDSGLINK